MITASEPKIQAISLMVVNCFFAAAIPVIVKFTGGKFALASLMAAYHLVATILSAIWVIMRKESFVTNILPLHLIRSALTTLAYFLYFYSVKITSLANAVAIGHTDAILTCLFACILLKEKLSRIEIINLFLSFIGVLMIAKPNAEIVNIGAILTLISANAWALSNILTKVMSKHDSVILQVFYSNLLTFIFSGIVAIYNEEQVADLYNMNIIFALILGIMMMIQYSALFMALKITKAGIIMPFFAIGVVFGDIFGYAFFDELQDPWECAGTLLIIGMSIYQIISIRAGKI